MSDTTLASMKNRRLAKKSLSPVPHHLKGISYVLTTLFAISTLFPLLIVISASFSTQDAISYYGYTIFPKEISFDGYKYIWENIGQIVNAYGITILTTVFGTIYGLIIDFMYAYVLSRPQFPWKKFFTFFAFFTMLFSGGMLSSYMVMTTVYHLQDTFWALVLPMGVTAMHIIIMRTYLTTNIPNEVIESAEIDGASEWVCLFKIIIPMAVPVIATIALFLAIAYWNDWQQGFLYIFRNESIVPIQLLIRRIEQDALYLSSNANSLGASVEEMKSTLPIDSFRMGLVIVSILPILLSYPFFQKYFMTGLTIGSVKG